MNVLVSGAHVAGLTLAYWLKRRGIECTLVERAPAPRSGGQAIDVRGVALDVLRGMGLYEAAQAKRTKMSGMSAVDGEGKELFRSEERSFSGGRFDSGDIEILRDDLADLLRATVPDVRCLYDDTITGLTEHADGVDVEFARGPARRFDVVVGAAGVHSRVRALAFGGSPAQFLEPLGMALAIFSAPNILGLRDWQVAYREATAGGLVYTARDNTELRVTVGFAAPPGIPAGAEAQKRLVLEQCRELRWELPRLLEWLLPATDFYFGPVAKVIMPRWSTERIVLVGDAGYAPTPLSGQGTSLALVVAHVLAEELARAPIATAFARYEERLRPYVTAN